jgi:hypothetical protein
MTGSFPEFIYRGAFPQESVEMKSVHFSGTGPLREDGEQNATVDATKMAA